MIMYYYEGHAENGVPLSFCLFYAPIDARETIVTEFGNIVPYRMGISAVHLFK